MQIENKDEAKILNNVKTVWKWWKNILSCYFVNEVMQFSA